MENGTFGLSDSDEFTNSGSNNARGQVNISASINTNTSPYTKILGVVERITYHNSDNGWSVLRVSPQRSLGGEIHYHSGSGRGGKFAGVNGNLITVVLTHTEVHPGATMEFTGEWIEHREYGWQFRAQQVSERRPANVAALEKYLGSGLISGVGPAIASRIVKHFGDKTLEVFDGDIDRLLEVEGIADNKLRRIRDSWLEHQEVRDIMIFLQGHGISTLFAVKIFKTYGNKSVEIVSANPYRLANDIYGIGFFSADKIARNLGFEEGSAERICAAIRHALNSSRDEGHCYLTEEQLFTTTCELLKLDLSLESFLFHLQGMEERNELRTRNLGQLQQRWKRSLGIHSEPKVDDLAESASEEGAAERPEALKGYYFPSLFFDEAIVAKRIKKLLSRKIKVDQPGLQRLLDKAVTKSGIILSEEQLECVKNILASSFSILTGGPGCGKTTTTKVIVKLLLAMGKAVILAAPTGRAAQRMTEVIGLDAKTIHRLLIWNPATHSFKKCADDPLEADFLIVDECSMLDISLSADLLKAVSDETQVLFIGDVDQLPAVGAGNVLKDLMASRHVPYFVLTKIFRQAEQSLIIKYAHEINKGLIPKIESPIRYPAAWTQQGIDCLFIDSEEVTKEQMGFILKARKWFQYLKDNNGGNGIATENVEGLGEGLVKRYDSKRGEYWQKAWSDINGDLLLEELYTPPPSPEERGGTASLSIPKKLEHVDLKRLSLAQEDGRPQETKEIEEIKGVLKQVHPWSIINYGMRTLDMIKKLYGEFIPKYLGASTEIQILSPMLRGGVGTIALNQELQSTFNPLPAAARGAEDPALQIAIGDRMLRKNDRVIQRRNNYELGVFNGDIGIVEALNGVTGECTVLFDFKGKHSGELTSGNISLIPGRRVFYKREDLLDLDLAYAITVHKSQGSEFDVVIMPVVTQHFRMLFRNLIYTGLTRAKRMAIFIGTRKALAMAIKNIDSRQRQTTLKYLFT
ncbi:MAG: AAA family ATPase [Oligoflexia bacterium]|nr:AAA family ATPase [Oligoflexia bacterium]